MATVVPALRVVVMSEAFSSVEMGGTSLSAAMAVLFPAPTGPVKMIL